MRGRPSPPAPGPSDPDLLDKVQEDSSQGLGRIRLPDQAVSILGQTASQPAVRFKLQDGRDQGFGVGRVAKIDVLLVMEELLGRRRPGGDYGLLHAHRLEDLVGDHATGLLGRPEDPETDIGRGDLSRKVRVPEPALELHVREGERIRPQPDPLQRLAGADEPESDGRILLGEKGRGFDDAFRAVKRKERAEEEDLERRIFRLGRRRVLRPEQAVVVSDGDDGDLVLGDSVGPAEIVLVGRGIGQDKVAHSEGHEVDPEVPPGADSARPAAPPVDDLGLVAGGQGVEDQPFGEEQGKEAAQGHILLAEFR